MAHTELDLRETSRVRKTAAALGRTGLRTSCNPCPGPPDDRSISAVEPRTGIGANGTSGSAPSCCFAIRRLHGNHARPYQPPSLAMASLTA